MTVDSARLRFQQRQADLFRDTVTVVIPSTGGTLNPTTGVWTPNAPTLVYSGAALVRSFTWQGTSVNFGEEPVRLQRARIKLPLDTPVEVSHVVTVTASTYDTEMVGRSYRVTDVFHDGWQICRVVIAEEVVDE